MLKVGWTEKTSLRCQMTENLKKLREQTVGVCEKGFPSREKNVKCKGPEVGMYLTTKRPT